MAITKIQSESLNLADNYDFTGTVTGAGESNAPYFFAGKSGDQTISDATWTKIQMNSEILDSASEYDPSTNYRFTPQTAGKYLVYLNLSIYTTGGATDLRSNQCLIYKNGSAITNSRGATGYAGNPGQFGNVSTSAIVDMNGTTDYLEAYGYGDSNGGSNCGVESGNSGFYAFLIST